MKDQFATGKPRAVVRKVTIAPRSEFAERVRVRRIELGLTHKQVADAIDGHASGVSAVEAGRLLLNLPKFVKLCRALQTTPNALLGFEP